MPSSTSTQKQIRFGLKVVKLVRISETGSFNYTRFFFQVAVRVKFLEHENAILRAQVITLREEATSLRRMLLQRGETELSPGVHQIYVS